MPTAETHGFPGKRFKDGKPEALAEARSTYAKDIRFYQMLQYLFFKQWWELKAYVNEKGIEIIGDVPIYVAGDSADVWANPEEFYLDEDLNPIDVAGVSAGCIFRGRTALGQSVVPLGCNEEKRIHLVDETHCGNVKSFTILSGLTIFADLIPTMRFRQRIRRQKNGEWRKGPGMDLFHTLEQKLGRLNIIVEDLGF